jgi:glycine/D-amino acid oxidase-like deaminating enzyme/nitrite reductase/ring-hydroxylating ferredoxin subunit
VERVATLVSAHAIDCDLERITHFVFAEYADERAKLESEAEAATRAGLPVELVHEPETPFPAIAALALAGQLQFHPRKYLLGLARAVVHAGGVIYQDARVEAVERGVPRRISLPGGTVSAHDVVLATHVPFGLKGSFFARLEAHAAYAVGMPVAEGVVEGAWINVGMPTRSIRTTPLAGDGRLLVVVGEGHVVGRDEDPRAHYDALADYVDLHITDEDVAYRWSTQDQYAVDGLPYIGRVGGKDDGVYVGTGFAGWGLSNGTLAAMLITDAIVGRENEWSRIYSAERHSVLKTPAALVKQNFEVAKELIGGKLLSRGESVADVQAGSGEVLDLGGERAAVHRAEDGRLTAVSAICTHMGCDVTWNSAESTWDCPCHGSRFTIAGDVLEGPATRPLEPLDISSPTASL